MLFVTLKCEDIRNETIILIDKKLYNVSYSVLSKDKKNIVFYVNEINTDDFLISEKLEFFTFAKKQDIKKIVAIVENLVTKINKNNKDIKMISQTLIDLQESKKELLSDIKKSIKQSKENVFINNKNTSNDFYNLKSDKIQV